MFCEEDGLLDVKHLLLYLCADPYPRAGLFKALSLVTGSVLLPNQVSALTSRHSLRLLHILAHLGGGQSHHNLARRFPQSFDAEEL